jgi:hypothetical protein
MNCTSWVEQLRVERAGLTVEWAYVVVEESLWNFKYSGFLLIINPISLILLLYRLVLILIFVCCDFTLWY